MWRGQPLNRHKTQVTYNVRRGKPLDQHNATQETKLCVERPASRSAQTQETKTHVRRGQPLDQHRVHAKIHTSTVRRGRPLDQHNTHCKNTSTEHLQRATHSLTHTAKPLLEQPVLTVVAEVALAIPVEDEACGRAILSEKVRRSAPQ